MKFRNLILILIVAIPALWRFVIEPWMYASKSDELLTSIVERANLKLPDKVDEKTTLLRMERGEKELIYVYSVKAEDFAALDEKEFVEEARRVSIQQLNQNRDQCRLMSYYDWTLVLRYLDENEKPLVDIEVHAADLKAPSNVPKL